MRYGYYSDIALQEKREKLEKDRKRLLQRTTNVLSRLSKEVKFSQAYLFGSLTQQNRFTEDSDVDIGFLGLADEDFFYSIAFLSREIGRDVDVIQLERHPFKEKIQTTGVKTWTKNS
jgi:predicted nucleotidyltransferase